LPHITSLREGGAIIYSPSEDGRRHGNFLSRSYAAILDHEPWRKRLAKAHTGKKKLAQLERETTRPWCELDSCNSSDALLMKSWFSKHRFSFSLALLVYLRSLSLCPQANHAVDGSVFSCPQLDYSHKPGSGIAPLPYGTKAAHARYPCRRNAECHQSIRWHRLVVEVFGCSTRKSMSN